MKDILRSVLARLGYRIMREAPLNRFQAIESALESLAARGLAPDLIVDGGANLGEFARTMRALFPAATVHMVEPQPGCHGPLKALVAGAGGRAVLHPVALASPARHGTQMAMMTDADMTSTGGHLMPGAEAGTGPETVTGTGTGTVKEGGDGAITVPLETLDHRLAGHLNAGDRVLLKLDLQGFEMEALEGAFTTLQQTECILCEVSFYRQAHEPLISELVGFLAGHGFELYDIGSIYARPRDNRPRQGDFVFLRTDSPLAADTGWG